MFNDINQLRQHTTSSNSYRDALAMKWKDPDSRTETTETFNNSEFPLRQGNVDPTKRHTQKLTGGNDKISKALEYISKAHNLAPLEWSEGLTLAAKEYAEAWAREDSAPDL